MNDEHRQRLPVEMREPLGFISFYDRFVDSLQKRNYSPRTLHSYSHHLHRFFTWCAERSIMSPTEVTGRVIEQFQKHLKNRRTAKGAPLTPSSVHGTLSSLGCFFKWLFKKDYLLANPARAIVLPEIKREPPAVLTHQEMEMVIARPDIETEAGVRNRAILETFYSTGIRRRELAKLDIEDIDLDRGLVLVREGKGNKQRVVPIGERATRWIEKYLVEARPLLAKDSDEQTLFISRTGKPLEPNSLTELVGDYVRECGLAGSCHLFRHTAATLMLENGAPIGHIQDFLGHLDIATTHLYTAVSLDKLKEVVGDTHPATDAETDQSSVSPFKPPKGEKPSPPKKIVKDRPYLNCPLGEHALAFFKSMHEQRYAEPTISKTRNNLDHFLQWCFDRSIFAPHQITHAILDHFQSYLMKHKKQDGRYLAASYRHRLLISLSAFLRHLFEREIIAVDPEKVIDMPKTPRKLPRHLTQGEIEKIMTLPDTTTPIGVRNRTILELLYATALHSREFVDLKLEDLDLENGTIHIAGGDARNRNKRTIPLTPRAIHWLDTYLRHVRPAMTSAHSDNHIFLGRYGKSISAATLHELLRRHIAAADIGKSGGCQLFRYAASISMLENGADIRHLQEYLGHRSLATTQGYSRFAVNKLKETHDKTHPAKMYPTQGQEIRKELESDPGT